MSLNIFGIGYTRFDHIVLSISFVSNLQGPDKKTIKIYYIYFVNVNVKLHSNLMLVNN